MPDPTTSAVEAAALDPVTWLIASVLDYPSAYMGGPSLHSRKKAERIIGALVAEGYQITKPEVALDAIAARGAGGE